MKTLEETKDTIAVKHGFVDWIAVMFYHNCDELNSEQLSEIVDEVATEYAKQMCGEIELRNDELKKALQDLIDHSNNFLAANGANAYNDCFKFIQVAIDILNTPNVVTTKCEHKNINRSDGLDECLDCGVRNY